jgi:hypothetical protein
VSDGEAVADRELESVCVGLRELVGVKRTTGVKLSATVSDTDGDSVMEPVRATLSVSVSEADTEGVLLMVFVALTESDIGVEVSAAVWMTGIDILGDGDSELLALTVSDDDPLELEDSELECDGLGDSVAVSLAVVDLVEDSLPDSEHELDTDKVNVGLNDKEDVDEMVGVVEGVMLAEIVVLDESEMVGVTVGVTDGDGVGDGFCSATIM